jgi:hypothetical protein
MKPYEGKETYIFVSYAHKDSALVLPILEAMTARGFRIWYDTGLEAGADFVAKIDERLSGAHCVLVFHSERLLASRTCAREIAMAYANKTPVVLALLEPVYLSHEVSHPACVQLLPYRPYESAEAFADALAALSVIQECKDNG